ncbi:MAG: MMPL family transporter, partial [Myxococcota bacterium]
VADAIVAVRPQGLEALDVQRDIQAIFGGETGHWLVVVSDVDPEVARERTDRITEALSERPENLAVLDSPSMLVPAAATQRARLAAREALGPLRSRLEEALTDTGFAPDRFTEALNALDAKPSLVTVEELRADRQSQLLLRRYLGRDGPQTVVVTYVVPKRGRERAVEAIVAASDPRAAITGYGRLDQSLRRTLAEELPRVGAVAAVLVLLSLAFALRRARDVVVAGLVVGAEIALVLALLGATDIPLHIYDALVLPVLLGITVDEVMFLLFRARRASIEETLEREGPPVATTALTTAAGFAGLLICDFDGLRHLGAVGALGSAGGLVMALLLVPATLRLASRAG